MLFITHKLHAYFLNSSRCPLFTAMHCCKPVCQLQYAPLCRSTSTAQLSEVACLCSWTVMTRRDWRSVRNRTGKFPVQWGGATERAERCRRNYGHSNTVLHVPTLHCDRIYDHWFVRGKISGIKRNRFMLYVAQIAICSQINTKHIKFFWILNCQSI